MSGRTSVLLLVLVAVGCEGAHDSSAGTRAPVEHPSPTAATSGAPAIDDTPPQSTPDPLPTIAAPPGTPGARAPAPGTEVVVVPLAGVQTAEDGHGAMIPARDAVAIEVRGHVGGQALGPELRVGQLRFVEHTYPTAGVVRFVCADRALLSAGAEVALVYGTRRIVVTSSLQVPQ